MVVLGGGAVLYERGIPVILRPYGRQYLRDMGGFFGESKFFFEFNQKTPLQPAVWLYVFFLQGYLAHQNTHPPQDHTVGLCPGS